MKRPIIFLVGGLLLEALAVWILLEARETSLGPILLLLAVLHIAACALVSYGIYFASQKSRFLSPKNWFLASLALSIFLPPAGPFLMVGIYVLASRSHWEKTDIYEEYEKYIAHDFKPEEKHMPSDKLLEEIGERLEVSPLVDVINQDDVKLRRGAVQVMNKLPKKDAVRLLKLAAQDANVEIRFAASSELSEMEAEMNDNIGMALRDVEAAPNSVDARLALANAYADYYDSGILDASTAEYYRSQAFEEYTRVLELGGDNIHVLNYLGNLEIQRKNYDDALKHFKRVVEIEPSDIFANVGVIQVYYERGDIKQVVERASNLVNRMTETLGPMREIITFWAYGV